METSRLRARCQISLIFLFHILAVPTRAFPCDTMDGRRLPNVDRGLSNMGGRTSPILMSLASSDSESKHVDGDSVLSTEHRPPKKYYNETDEFPLTGIRRDIDWPIQFPAVPPSKELDLLKSGVLLKQGEFCRLDQHGKRFHAIQQECFKQGMTISQGLVIRQQLMVSKAINRNWLLRQDKTLNFVRRKFERQQMGLLDLANKLDLPPVSIIRALVAERVDHACRGMRLRQKELKYIVKSVIFERDPDRVNEILTSWELEQLRQAKAFDCVGYNEEYVEPGLWEDTLYAFLDQQNIRYVEEEVLRDADMVITPDCLILDECYINGQKVRWIDAKCFYGSGLKENRHFTKKLTQQISKYESEFGESGAVIFKHGFCEKLQALNPSTLLLDAGPLLLD